MSDMNIDPQPPMSEFHRMVAEALDLAGAPPGPTVIHRIASLGEQRDKAQAGNRLLEDVEALKLRRAAKTDVVADLQRQLDQITEAHAHVQAILDRMGVPGGGLAWRLNWAAEKYGAQVNILEEVQHALNGVRAPLGESLAERVQKLSAQAKEANGHWVELLEGVRKALNFGPPSDSDVKPGTDPKRIVDVVRTRTERLLDERSRRVALAEEVQALERQIVQERQQAINRLLLWMSGERCEIASELLDQVARAVEAGIVTADDANDARRNRRVLATLVLNVDFGKPRTDDIPFRPSLLPWATGAADEGRTDTTPSRSS